MKKIKILIIVINYQPYHYLLLNSNFKEYKVFPMDDSYKIKVKNKIILKKTRILSWKEGKERKKSWKNKKEKI